MSDRDAPMGTWTRIAVLLYLLASSALLLYLVSGLWGAVPRTVAPAPVEEQDLSAEAAPTNGTPEIVQVVPERITLGTERPAVQIFGHNFDAESAVQVAGATRSAQLISANQLFVTLDPADVRTPGVVVLRVVKEDQTSNAEMLLVESLATSSGEWRLFAWPVSVSLEERLLLLVIFTGAFGASIMALQSLADYRGQKKLTTNWTIFYVVRPPLGGGIAFVFYLVIRGGFMAGADVDLGPSAPFGIIAVSALVGMFSDRAILKLREIFLNLFKADDTREGKLGDPVIETTALPDAKVGTAYSVQLKATSGTPPYTWSVDRSLPADLTISSTGVVSGTPQAAAAKAPYTFKVTDDRGATASAKLDLQVLP